MTRTAEDSEWLTLQAVALATELTASLADGTLTLPSYPEIATRIRRVLAEEHATPERIGRVVSSEPALAASLLRMANSVALNPGGCSVTDVKAAVARLGLNIVRSATISYALCQVKSATEMRGLEAELDALWQESTLVAAICFVTASRVPGLNPNEALLAGLLHNVGTLYLLSRRHKFPEVMANEKIHRHTVRTWDAKLTASLLTQWEIPGRIVEAVVQKDAVERAHSGPPDLADILIIACVAASLRSAPEELLGALHYLPAAGQMGLDGRQVLELLSASQEQMRLLRAALGP